MAISSLNKPNVLNWELITTSSPSGLSTITLSSIDTVYSKLLLTWNLTATANSGNLTMKLNNDAGTNYRSQSIGFSSTISVSGSNSSIVLNLGVTNTTGWDGFAIIDEASTTNGKTVKSSGIISGGIQYLTETDAFYAASAAISQIDLLHSASLSGTVKLYGVRV